jgi:hypothetical protein
MIGVYCERCIEDHNELTYCPSVKKFLCEDCILILAENAYNQVNAKEDTNVHDHD